VAKEEMAMENTHISALMSKHADIDARINEESQRPQPDMATLTRLKKAKLKLKEEITRL
jgi:uncharacterized protein